MSEPGVNWTTPAELRAAVQKRWERGDLLRSIVTGESLFPLRVPLRGPGSKDLSARFEEVRRWIAELRAAAHVRIEMREVAHRVLGSNSVPESAWVDSLEDALALCGKARDTARFRALLELTRALQPGLLAWLAKRPLHALELSAVWERLLAIVAWIQAHPRPGIYLRQVDIGGVHTKLIEAHRGVLSELLDLVLPAAAIDPGCSGTARFAARFGFLEKPVRIRFRVLDPSLALLPGVVERADISLDAGSFARLTVAARVVFITENETNFLAFPGITGGLVIFGAGYGWDALSQAAWLHECALFYWGDIDTHGFAILDSLRSRFPHARSFLMDGETLLAHPSLWGREDAPIAHDLPRLTPDERALFNELRDQRLGTNLRLEQELIGFGWVQAALQAQLGAES